MLNLENLVVTYPQKSNVTNEYPLNQHDRPSKVRIDRHTYLELSISKADRDSSQLSNRQN